MREQLKSLAPLLLGFMAVTTIMMVSNALNGRNGDAWSIAVNFSLRYGLLIFVLTYFHRLGLLSPRRMVIFIWLGLLVQAGLALLNIAICRPIYILVGALPVRWKTPIHSVYTWRLAQGWLCMV